MKSFDEILKEMFTVGSPLCALLGGIIGALIGLSLLLLGFWKTVFIVIVCLLGIFIGGVKQKGEYIKKTINRVLPPSNNNNNKV